MRRLAKEKLTDKEFDSLDASFNYNTPTDSSAVLSDLIKQRDAGALSKKSLIELSPYTTNAEAELKEINRENATVSA